MTHPESTEQLPASIIWLVIMVLGVIGALVVMMTAPTEHLLGPSSHAVRGAVHGTAAGLFMITSTVGFFQAYRIASGKAWNIVELQLGGVVNAMMSLLTIISGNWIYIPYRAPDGPRSYFMQQTPDVHKVFFEFKEFAALFTFPLAVTAAYLLVRYGSDLYRRKGLSTTIAALIVLVFFYFVVAFGLGAAVTKLKSV